MCLERTDSFPLALRGLFGLFTVCGGSLFRLLAGFWLLRNRKGPFGLTRCLLGVPMEHPVLLSQSSFLDGCCLMLPDCLSTDRRKATLNPQWPNRWRLADQVFWRLLGASHSAWARLQKPAETMHLNAELTDAVNISDHICRWVLIIHKLTFEQKRGK